MKHYLTSLTICALVTLAAAAGRAGEPAGLSDLAEPIELTEPAEYETQFTTVGYTSRPKWTVSAGAVFLHRNGPEPKTIVVDPQDGSELMNTTDLAPGWGTGPRFEITRHLDRCTDFQIVYFSVDNWSNVARAQNASPATGESYWDPFVFNDINAGFNTKLHSLELNLRRPLFGRQWLYGLVGFRYAHLKDEFSTHVSLVVPPVTLWNSGYLDVENNLYGLQIGLEPVVWNPCGPLRIDGFIKAGIYGNDVDWLLRTQGLLDNRVWHKKGCQASFIGEIAVKATYDFCRYRCRAVKPTCSDPESCEPAACSTAVCRRWSLFAGYEALWLGAVATAEQQKLFIDYDSAFYHGAMVGIEIPLGRSCCGTGASCGGCQ